MGAVKTVLLTGATGYLGKQLLAKLLTEGYNVCIVKRETSDLVGIYQHLDKIQLYNSDESSLAKLFDDNCVDIVIHTATLYGRKGESFLEIKNANLDLPATILSFALKHNVKYFINTGTSLPIFTNTYSLFKSQFAQCLNYSERDINSVNVVLEHFYGPKDDDSKFITAMMKRMLAGNHEIDLTAGTQLRDFIFIDDVLDAYMLLIEKISDFRGYNDIPVGSGDVVTIRSIVESIKKYTQSESRLNFGAIAMRENELLRSDADITKLKQLGWIPKYTLDEGLKITIQDLTANSK